MRIILIALGLSVPVMFADEAASPRGAEESVRAVLKEYEGAEREYRDAVSGAKTPAERKEILGRFNERKNDLARRAMRLAQDRPKDAAAVEALTWIVRVRTTPLTAAALQILRRDHLDNEAILPACWYSSALPGRHWQAVEALLRDASMKSQSHKVRGLASYYLAGFLHDRAKAIRHLGAHPEDRAQFERLHGAEAVTTLLRRNADELTRESERLYERIVSDDAGLTTLSGLDLVTRAKGELFELRNLSVGRLFPEIEGRDVEGRPFKLSDDRGKVVVLTFSGTWCGACMAMYPHQRRLVERMNGKPFALLSVNAEADEKALRKAIASDEITWKCWCDLGPRGSGSGPICQRLGINVFPTIFVIDRRGMIRYQGVQGHKLDEAVDRLLNENEPTLQQSGRYPEPEELQTLLKRVTSR